MTASVTDTELSSWFINCKVGKNKNSAILSISYSCEGLQKNDCYCVAVRGIAYFLTNCQCVKGHICFLDIA